MSWGVKEENALAFFWEKLPLCRCLDRERTALPRSLVV